METAELTISLSVSPLHHPPFVLIQAENDLNELRALMHSPNAIVVSSPSTELNDGQSGGSRIVTVIMQGRRAAGSLKAHTFWMTPRKV